MCGYLGELSLRPFDRENLFESNLSQVCRGPDETKYLEKVIGQKNYNLSLVFNRLSIIDLSGLASQPMVSEEFKTLIVFNGEIYNHNELRKSLENYCTFKTSHSDTEVLLNGLSLEGPSFLNKVRGQFSLVFIDYKNVKVLMARDRLGQKPLFYKHIKDSLIFSTNLKSLIKQSSDTVLDEKQVTSYLNYGVVPSPNTLFKNIYKLKPANFIIFDLNKRLDIVEDKIYWKPESFIGQNKFNQDTFIEKFKESLKLRLESDVPVSTFLSGGLDSSSITKGLSDLGGRVNTFSVTHVDKKYDESFWINEVVEKYGTNHTEIQIDQNTIDEAVTKAVNGLDEPYADPSIVPSFVLSRAISKEYKVALSGDGGDELLGGYKRFQIALKDKSSIENFISKTYPMYPGFLGSGSNLLMKSKNPATSYFSTLEDDKFLRLLGFNKNDFPINSFTGKDEDVMKLLTLAEYNFFLSEMMVVKIDRTSMNNSLEVRSPFIDHKLIEYILNSNMSEIIIQNAKQPLKKYLSNDFSSEFLNRKKMGFSLNVEKWIYNNTHIIKEIFNEGEITSSLNPNILNKLSIFKSRINAHRIWKLYILESYLNSLKK